VTAADRILEKARVLAAAALDTEAEGVTWSNGRWSASGSDGPAAKTIEDVALYAHRTRPLPPGDGGWAPDAQAVYRD